VTYRGSITTITSLNINSDHSENDVRARLTISVDLSQDTLAIHTTFSFLPSRDVGTESVEFALVNNSCYMKLTDADWFPCQCDLLDYDFVEIGSINDLSYSLESQKLFDNLARYGASIIHEESAIEDERLIDMYFVETNDVGLTEIFSHLNRVLTYGGLKFPMGDPSRLARFLASDSRSISMSVFHDNSFPRRIHVISKTVDQTREFIATMSQLNSPISLPAIR
jgi:hypothetical protein